MPRAGGIGEVCWPDAYIRTPEQDQVEVRYKGIATLAYFALNLLGDIGPNVILSLFRPGVSAHEKSPHIISKLLILDLGQRVLTHALKDLGGELCEETFRRACRNNLSFDDRVRDFESELIFSAFNTCTVDPKNFANISMGVTNELTGRSRWILVQYITKTFTEGPQVIVVQERGIHTS
uniref:hypothetical protein n=1 Tax=Pseudomonas aeruginosa TaxID=287 RepID=UPI001882BF59|nr:hypothetical protein [Pseudomonas aeruginosa]